MLTAWRNKGQLKQFLKQQEKCVRSSVCCVRKPDKGESMFLQTLLRVPAAADTAQEQFKAEPRINGEYNLINTDLVSKYCCCDC